MVKELIRDAGLGPRKIFPEWGMLADLAVAIEATIQDPVDRAAFAAFAAKELRETPPNEAATHLNLDRVAYLVETADNARPTPAGSVELWGSVWHAGLGMARESEPELSVAWHEGGQLFAGDETEYPRGWYLFQPGLGATPVTVFKPGTNDPLVPGTD